MASRDLDCEKVDHLIVPEAPSPKAHALTELGQDALLPQMLNDQHDFAKPRRRRGNGVRRGLDDDRRIGDTGHVYLLVRKDVYPSSREAHFMSARYKLHLVAQCVGTYKYSNEADRVTDLRMEALLLNLELLDHSVAALHELLRADRVKKRVIQHSVAEQRA